MLTATIAEAGDVQSLPPSTHPRPPVQVVVRRRRVVAALSGAAIGSALLGSAGLSAGWLLAALFVVLGAAYLTLVARLRHQQVRRQFDSAFGADSRAGHELDWAALEHDLRLSPSGHDDAAMRSPVEVDNRAIGRFLICWALGWLLTPVVAILGFVRRDLSQGLARRIVKWQRYGRSQSLRLLTVGAAAGVTLTAVGGLTATAGASTTVAAVSVARQPSAAPLTYSVAAGDTLSSISARSGESVADLAAANHLANPNFILPGETLTVTGPVAARASGPTAPYTVQKGDDLYSIARRHGTTVAALAQANGVSDPNLILVGQVLSVPAAVVGSAAPATATATATAAAKTAAVQKAATGATSHYVVRAGDTMEALARRYHTTVASLASASGIANPNQILPGQVVVVPATPAAPSIAAPVAAAVVQAKVATPAPAPTVAAPAPAPAVAAPKAAAPAPAPAPAAVTGLSALPLPAQYLHGGSVDQGVDYSAPGGTPLYAMGPGKIIRAGMSGFGPNCPVLEITAGPLAGKTVYYGHAGPNLVPVGATVAAGQQISIVGYGIVGYSTGPHLEVGFYPPGGNGAGGAMLQYINSVVGHSTAN